MLALSSSDREESGIFILLFADAFLVTAPTATSAIKMPAKQNFKIFISSPPPGGRQGVDASIIKCFTVYVPSHQGKFFFAIYNFKYAFILFAEI
jgi:hypothetical protein